jgi:hypothetical protein
VNDEDWATTLSLIQAATFGGLILIYLATYVHVRRGTKFELVSNLVIMLFISCLGGLLIAYSNYTLNGNRDFTELNIWFYGIGWGVFTLMFNTAHQMFAWQYHTMSTEIPRILEEKPISESYNKRQKCCKWFLMSLNIIFPCLLPIVSIRYSNAIYLNSNGCNETLTVCCTPSQIEEYSYDFVFVSIGVLQLISGTYLVRGVLKIRRFFVDRGEKSSINTRIMLTHSFAYGLYMTANVIYYLIFSYHVYTEPGDSK